VHVFGEGNETEDGGRPLARGARPTSRTSVGRPVPHVIAWADAIRLIDVLWLNTDGGVAAAFEVEHSISIYSRIVRMVVSARVGICPTSRTSSRAVADSDQVGQRSNRGAALTDDAKPSIDTLVDAQMPQRRAVARRTIGRSTRRQ
jgi:hypothetical protein